MYMRRVVLFWYIYYYNHYYHHHYHSFIHSYYTNFVVSSGESAAAAAAAASSRKRNVLETSSGTLMFVELVPWSTAGSSAATKAYFEKLPALPKPFLKLSNKVLVKHLRKYLLELLKLSTTTQIDILCHDEVLGSEHSLEFVHRTRWHEPRKHMQLQYRQSNL